MRQLLKIKTTFALALVFMAGVAFAPDALAQKDANVDQNGNNGTVDVTQNRQKSGDLDRAVVTQGGGKNLTEIDQLGDAGNNVAEVIQRGFQNDVFIDQSQSGANGNTAATAFQESGTSNNVIDVLQTSFGSEAGESFLSQINGTQNSEIDVDQSNRNKADAKQAGQSDSEIYIDQSGTRGYPFNSEVKAKQTRGGNNNVIDVTQSASFGSGVNDFIGSVAVTQRDADKATARIEQTGQDNAANEAEVFQTGFSSFLELDQNFTGSTGSPTGEGHFADVDQDGDVVARLSQEDVGAASSATIDQSGSGQRLSAIGDKLAPAIQQDGSSLTLTQTGSGNRAQVEQNGGSATINQSGSGNTTIMDQGTIE
ncbi:hypothetical protein [Salinibacter ruber]|uniref:hypothetical protein n=1 Tax=Salinibacter ruber TaxID=146919 RepID=UPI000E6CC482|nr:hypothetical protein [Salinibacter ruber]